MALIEVGLSISAGIATVGVVPEVASAVSAAARACATNPVLCENQAGIAAGEIAAGGAMPAGTGAAVKAAAAKLNNFYRDGASPELLQHAYIQAAISSTHNASSWKYIEGSSDSYEATAEARGSTYFSMSDWGAFQEQMGAENMWSINKAFLEQQMAQGKSSVLTVDPRLAPPKPYAGLEYRFFVDTGYRVMSG